MPSVGRQREAEETPAMFHNRRDHSMCPLADTELLGNRDTEGFGSVMDKHLGTMD